MFKFSGSFSHLLGFESCFTVTCATYRLVFVLQHEPLPRCTSVRQDSDISDSAGSCNLTVVQKINGEKMQKEISQVDNWNRPRDN